MARKQPSVFARMPLPFPEALPNVPRKLDRFRSGLQAMPCHVAEPTGSDDVAARVPSAVTSGTQVLRSASEPLGFSMVQAMLRDELLRMISPHLSTAIETAT